MGQSYILLLVFVIFTVIGFVCRPATCFQMVASDWRISLTSNALIQSDARTYLLLSVSYPLLLNALDFQLFCQMFVRKKKGGHFCPVFSPPLFFVHNSSVCVDGNKKKGRGLNKE